MNGIEEIKIKSLDFRDVKLVVSQANAEHLVIAFYPVDDRRELKEEMRVKIKKDLEDLGRYQEFINITKNFIKDINSWLRSLNGIYDGGLMFVPPPTNIKVLKKFVSKHISKLAYLFKYLAIFFDTLC